jgi:hypothetical protein
MFPIANTDYNVAFNQIGILFSMVAWILKKMKALLDKLLKKEDKVEEDGDQSKNKLLDAIQN